MQLLIGKAKRSNGGGRKLKGTMALDLTPMPTGTKLVLEVGANGVTTDAIVT